jgi:hypothetical protein
MAHAAEQRQRVERAERHRDRQARHLERGPERDQQHRRDRGRQARRVGPPPGEGHGGQAERQHAGEQPLPVVAQPGAMDVARRADVALRQERLPRRHLDRPAQRLLGVRREIRGQVGRRQRHGQGHRRGQAAPHASAQRAPPQQRRQQAEQQRRHGVVAAGLRGEGEGRPRQRRGRASQPVPIRFRW